MERDGVGGRDIGDSAGSVGIIGCGSMGARHVRAFIAAALLHPSLRVSHVCDRDPAKAREVAELFASAGLPAPAVTDRIDDVLAAGSLDAVDVVLPTAAHYEVCRRALVAGKHVLVEKPLALNTKEAAALVDAAAEHHRVLSVTENYRRLPANRALRRLLDRSDAVISMSSDIVCSPTHDRLHNAASWYSDPDTAGSYLGHEFGAHEMDLVRYLLGEVESVYCAPSFSGARNESDPRLASGLFALLRCSSGALARVALRSSEWEQPHGSRDIALGDGHVTSAAWEVWDGRYRDHEGADVSTDEILGGYHAGTSELAQRGLASGRPFFDRGDPLRSGTAAAVHEFALAVAGVRAPEIDGVDAARTLALCESLIVSARIGQPVSPAGVFDR